MKKENEGNLGCIINFISEFIIINPDMSQAKTMKLKEYGTDILSHSETVVDTPQTKNVRQNNTFKSSALSTEFEEEFPSKMRGAQSRDKLFKSKPLTAQIQRTSY